ncbi:MAG: Crp/Fnr family transcriptional regulator [Cyclobacteriaceae bacterium]|nr:Crp/Fnr family transcriptional regulator [Cyclobacteriaceae bacterium]
MEASETKDSLNLMRSLVTAIQPLNDDAWLAFSRLFEPLRVQRKEILTHIGGRELYLYFVVEGVQRVYYNDDDDRESTLVFTYAPSFGGVLDALMQQAPSRYNYESLTPSRFLRAPANALFETMKEHQGLEQLVRKGITSALSGVLERLVELQSFSAEERFRSLLRRSPHILQLVPHKYLANYLGIDPTNFSKFINSIKI